MVAALDGIVAVLGAIDEVSGRARVMQWKVTTS